MIFPIANFLEVVCLGYPLKVCSKRSAVLLFDLAHEKFGTSYKLKESFEKVQAISFGLESLV